MACFCQKIPNLKSQRKQINLDTVQFSSAKEPRHASLKACMNILSVSEKG